MRTRVLTLLVLALCTAGAASAAWGLGFERARATIVTARGPVELRVELARTSAQREQGLMGRRTLAADAGMLFLFDEPTRSAFWMKGTLVPLSIAFIDARWRIVRMLDMTPCRTAVCPLYQPGATYRRALEVRRGSFVRWGVRRGDRVVLHTAR